MKAIVIGLLLLLGTACGVTDPKGGATQEEEDTVRFNQPTRPLVASLGDLELYSVDVDNGTCYVAIRFAEIAVSCIKGSE